MAENGSSKGQRRRRRGTGSEGQHRQECGQGPGQAHKDKYTARMSLRLRAYGSGAANAEDELRRGGEVWRGGRMEGANEKDSLRERVDGVR